YPLRFEPIFRRYIWGGHRLATVLDKPIGDQSCAESWEIVDHNQDQSVVQFGELAGKSLSELIHEQGAALLGSSALEQIQDESIPEQLRGRFPLLLKFLDANRSLSVQVHPDDVLGAKLNPPDLGKTEAWYVMHADQGSKIYAGLKSGVTQDQLRSAIDSGTTEEVLHSFEPSTGDCVFIKAGTLHAIGEGLLIAEIQQASDTTFRVFDWNRVDTDGKPRQLHIEESLEATNFDLGPVNPVAPSATEFENATTIVTSDKFVMRRWNLKESIELKDDKLRILAVTKGSIKLSGDPAEHPLSMGQTAMIPSSCTSVELRPTEPSEVLDICLPY
ncbi:MAG: type I phosphomannose isomerase catalytic subunit, partial [Planctomycetota bacterium]